TVGQAFDLQPIDERANTRWRGVVSLMGRVVNPATRLVDTTLAFEGGAPPRPGTPLKAHAALDGEHGVLVPRAALVPEGDEMFVFVVRDGTCVRAPVQVSLTGRDQVVVSAGCAAGDHVIVSGQSQLASGDTVREVVAKDTPDPRSGGNGANR